MSILYILLLVCLFTMARKYIFRKIEQTTFPFASMELTKKIKIKHCISSKCRHTKVVVVLGGGVVCLFHIIDSAVISSRI